MPKKKVIEKSSKTAFEVVDELGNTVRVFTKDDHGNEAQANAESFAEKFGYRVK